MVKFEQVGESWPDMEYDALYRNDDIFGELFEFEHPELGLLGTFWPTEVLVIETITTH